MRIIIIIIMILSAIMSAAAQNSLYVYVKDKESKEALPGVTVRVGSNGNVTDAGGLTVINGIAAGKQVVEYKYTGYAEQVDTLEFPLADTITVYLQTEEEEMEEVMVSSTRSRRSIQDIPTRMEVINGEELGEKANMKPGDIRMLLSESTGIQTLQTSALSGNSSIRIQGMDGRYTQLLKDGFPMYAGFSGGLGLLQTAPLDLQQVEIIKGASSTLYGGGAIAGLVNLISKTPKEEKELSFVLNGTSALGLDASGFYGQRYGKVGLTMFAGFNGSKAYDPAGIGLSAIPKFTRYTFNPKLFFYPGKKTDIMLGANASIEKRSGGDMRYLKNESLTGLYVEENNSQRISTQLAVNHAVNEQSKLSLKNSVSYFKRGVNTPGYRFEGRQLSSFTEASYSRKGDKLEWVAGANLFTDGFNETKLDTAAVRNYAQTTIGVFVQNTWDISSKFFLETGLRGDYVIDYGPAILPRISLLYKISPHFSSRLGGGMGYKAPTIFTEESERIQYRNVLGINKDSNKLEQSYGANWDVNFRTTLFDGKVSFSVNQLFFYTHLNNPLMLTPVGAGQYRFRNVAAHIDAEGTETNIKIGYGHFKLYVGYTYTHSHLDYGSSTTETPLTPQHRVNNVLMYEIEDKLRIGLEAYYYSPQRLSDGSTGRDYWLCGLMAEKIWKHFSVFINFENFLDSRQTKFGSIYTGSINAPTFKDIYAPLDGFVVNGGLKLRL